MKRSNLAAVLPLLCLFSGSAFGQARTIEGVQTDLSFEDPSLDRMTVARVGSRTITAQEFLFNYEFGPAFTRRLGGSRRRHLEFMIYEKLLALDGYARRLNETEEARNVLAEIEGDLATEELYKDDVRSKVVVSQQEISSGIRGECIHFEVQWLYARTREETERQHEMLRTGIPFDSLFRLALCDSVSKEDRSMETSRFRLEVKNPVLARVLDTLASGSTSEPVGAPDGYYILKCRNKWRDALLGQSREIQLRQDVERVLIQQKSDSLSDLYVQKILTGRQAVILRQPFDVLQTHLARTVLPGESFARWNLAKRLLERWGPLNDSDIAPFKNQTLVQLKGSAYTVGDFIRWYGAREYNLRFSTSSPEAFFLSAEQMVWQMVRDKLLIERAISRGLEKRGNVRKQLEWWKDKIAYRSVRGEIADSIRWDDAALMRYYTEHPREYRDPRGGGPAPFAKVKDDVLRDFYSYELTKRLLHRIQALRTEYAVQVLEDTLNRVPMGEDEHDPRAIDVYVVKKGGTFPRAAFPSIDYEWQSWN